MADQIGVDLSLEKLTFDLTQATPLKGPRGKKRASRGAHRFRRKAAPGQSFEAPTHRPPRPTESGLSLLESLPFDILEKIFLESNNPHLPRAAPVIGAALSTSHTYNEFCRRLFCLPVHGRAATSISPPPSPPKSPTSAAEKQRLIEQDRRLGAHYRSLALQSRWATYDFLTSFNDSITRSKDLWFGRFSCEMPPKLLKWPMSNSQRTFFFALATAGATVDPSSLSSELAADVWHGSMQTNDAPMMTCLVERHIGPLPSRDERLQALEHNDFSLTLMRTFKDVRAARDRRGCGPGGPTFDNGFPEDWPEQWPLDDPEACASAMEKHNMGREELEAAITRANGPDKAWKQSFGGAQHRPY